MRLRRFLRFTPVLLSVACFTLGCSELEQAGSLATPAEPVDLERYERKVFSQFGEDGVIEKIFEIIEPTSKFCVEFGASDGVHGSNMRNLIINHGWSSFQIEGAVPRAKKLAENYRDYPNVKTLLAWVWPGNVEILFEENGVPKDLDFLVIDIDSNDYYVWRVMHEYRPKVVMVEANGFFPPPQLMVIDFHPMNYWDATEYHGASLQSWYNLGKKKGYELVYHMSSGVNAFFVEKQYFPLFGNPDNSPARLFRPPPEFLKEMNHQPEGRPGVPFAEERRYIKYKHPLKIEKKFIFNR